MENMHNTPTESATGEAATLAGSTKSKPKASMPLDGSKNTKRNTSATMSNVSPKTLKKMDLEALGLKIGLVAGAIADFQQAGGLVVMTQEEYLTSSGGNNKAIKLLLLVRDVDLVAERTTDGVDFRLVDGMEIGAVPNE